MQVKLAFSLSRLYTHFLGKPFAIVFAYVTGNEYNEARADAMKAEVRSKMGYGYREMQGKWVEKEGVNKGKTLTEYPLFIPGIEYDDALYLATGAYYPKAPTPQYSFIYSDGENISEVKTDDETIVNEFKNFEANDLNKIWEYYSKYKGRKFRYSSWKMPSGPPANPKGAAEHRAYYSFKEDSAHDFHLSRKQSMLRRVILTPHRILTAERVNIADKEYIEYKCDHNLIATASISRRPFLTIAKVARWAPSRFKRTFHIPENNARNWEINPKNFLLSKEDISRSSLERISWHPLTGEMILSPRGESFHDNDIHNHGTKPFDEYLRALVLPEKRKVVVRPWFPFNQNEMFRLENNEAEILSFEAQDALRSLLYSAGMPKSWTFEYDGNNARLEKLTGRKRW